MKIERKYRIWCKNTFNREGYQYLMVGEQKPKEAIGEIELYTTLKDKNGKEIYEGDIVKHHRVVESYTNYHTGEPEFRDVEYIRIGHITIRPSAGITLNGYVTEKDYQNDEVIEKRKFNGNSRNYSEFAEVIGNIYENKELLKNI